MLLVIFVRKEQVDLHWLFVWLPETIIERFHRARFDRVNTSRAKRKNLRAVCSLKNIYIYIYIKHRLQNKNSWMLFADKMMRGNSVE